MRFSSEDVAHQRFERRFRGYDTEQVREFLSVVGAHLSDYVVENQRLTRENDSLRKEVVDYRRREGGLQDALAMAKNTVTEVTERANREADVIVAEAELAAQRKLVGAERAVQAARDALAALKDQRRRVISEMRSTLEMHLHLIDSDHVPANLGEDSDVEQGPDVEQASDEDDDRGQTLPGIF